jgi:nucleotide-binding universal stress UspA family protein
MFPHLLVTADGSQRSPWSIASAIDLAKPLGARVTGLHVVADTLVAAVIGVSLRDPDEPVEAAQSKGCDLIHMASQGKGMIAGLFLGSETSKVVAQGTVPVLVYC